MPTLTPLGGSFRKSIRGARPCGKRGDGDELIRVLVRVRERKPIPDEELITLSERLPKSRDYLTPTQYLRRHMADPDAVSRIKKYAHDHKMRVDKRYIAANLMQLTGKAKDFEKAFGCKLSRYQLPGNGMIYRGREGDLNIPDDLEADILGIHGLDNRPLADTSLVNTNSLEKKGSPIGISDIRNIMQRYNFPSDLTGKGQCIAIIILNNIDVVPLPGKEALVPSGGFDPVALKQFFRDHRVNHKSITIKSIDGGKNLPGRQGSIHVDREAALDIAVAGTVAPDATIAVYFCPQVNSDDLMRGNYTKGIIDALNQALFAPKLRPSVISISLAADEPSDPKPLKQFYDTFNETLKAAALLGVTVCCSSGNTGALGALGGNEQNQGLQVAFPASSPWALGCGGTMPVVCPRCHDGWKGETTWKGRSGKIQYASSGGFSKIFPRPSYQGTALEGYKHNGRGVPDIAGFAAGYDILVHKQYERRGGTSSVAPLIAGLIACINEGLERKHKGKGKTAGFINHLIYRHPEIFTDVTSGTNSIYGRKGYAAHPGWDPCTGLGVPDGEKLLKLLTR
jgi:kumamolisin